MNNKSLRWKRPENVPFPSVWKRFKGRREINGVVPNFWIQDIPETEFENVLDFMMAGFAYDEPMNKYSNLPNDIESLITHRRLLDQVLQHMVGLVCYTDNPDPNGKPIIAGANCTYIKTKNDPKFEAKGEPIIRIFDTLDEVIKRVDAFELLKTDVILGSMGMSVSPQFRNQGLGLELLNAREYICKACGIKATATTFSAKSSQILAEKAGYKMILEVSYNELEKVNPRFVFPGIEEDTDVIQYMYKEFDV